MLFRSFTMETSIYAYTLGEETLMFSDRDYFRLGEDLIVAFRDYMILQDQLQVEILDTGYKQGKAVGVPAADLFRMEIQEGKEIERKKERKEKFRLKYDKSTTSQKTEDKNCSSSKLSQPHKIKETPYFANATANKTTNDNKQKSSFIINNQKSNNQMLMVQDRKSVV